VPRVFRREEAAARGEVLAEPARAFPIAERPPDATEKPSIGDGAERAPEKKTGRGYERYPAKNDPSEFTAPHRNLCVTRGRAHFWRTLEAPRSRKCWYLSSVCAMRRRYVANFGDMTESGIEELFGAFCEVTVPTSR